jgi:uncharacterized protein YebE (UPF0316 family)
MTISWEVLATCFLIIAARVGDVSLGTLRTVCVINGRRLAAWSLGFVEVLIWILVVSTIIATVRDNILYAFAYALGFATGTFVGITIEQRLAFGEQVIRVFSRAGHELARILRAEGYGITEFEGRGRDGPVQMLFIETRRRDVPLVVRRARSVDPECFYIVDDVRVASSRAAGGQVSGLASVHKGK